MNGEAGGVSRGAEPERTPAPGSAAAAHPARHPTARACQPAAHRLAIVRDQPGELAERHLTDVVQRQQIARLVVEVVEGPAQEGEHGTVVGLVGAIAAPGSGRSGVVPSQHLQPVPGAAPVAGGDAAADLAQPQVHPTDRGQQVLPLPCTTRKTS